MPTAWRIVKTEHAASAFDGEGARLYGGRWNSPGTAMIYTAQSQSLAALEILVHVQASALLSSYSAIPVRFRAAQVSSIEPSDLPADWRSHPAPTTLQEIGDQWVAGAASAVLQVPSVVIADERNYLINPGHRDFRRLEIGEPRPFDFDPRLA